MSLPTDDFGHLSGYATRAYLLAVLVLEFRKQASLQLPSHARADSIAGDQAIQLTLSAE
jgi:hypothetical protein